MPLSHKSRCDICGSEDHEVRYNLGRHKIIRCRGCTFMWLTPVPTIQELHEVYGAAYFKNQDFFAGENETVFGYADYLAERFDRQSNYITISQKIAATFKRFQPGQSRLLDIGCGFGFFLDVAQDEGFDVQGIEFNDQVVNQARKKYSFPIRAGDVMDIRDESFDVITMFDVIEHLPDPIRAVQKCRELLAPEGLFVITTMDSDSFVSRLFGARLEDFRRVREHLTFFTRRSIRKLLTDQGFEVLNIASYGHTFKLHFLAQRVQGINKFLGTVLLRMVDGLRLGKVSIDFNPHTKMIILARRR